MGGKQSTQIVQTVHRRLTASRRRSVTETWTTTEAKPTYAVVGSTEDICTYAVSTFEQLVYHVLTPTCTQEIHTNVDTLFQTLLSPIPRAGGTARRLTVPSHVSQTTVDQHTFRFLCTYIESLCTRTSTTTSQAATGDVDYLALTTAIERRYSVGRDTFRQLNALRLRIVAAARDSALGMLDGRAQISIDNGSDTRG
jgi:hypothetical protein